MADTRSVDDLVAAITAMQAQLDDLSSTSALRTATRPTGTLEPTIRNTAPAGALLCQGQTVLRSTYPTLVQFATDQGILGGTTPVFGVGDGSTTFTLPNMTGRYLVGTGVLSGDTYSLGVSGGNAHPVLTTAQMPSHNHPTNSSGSTSSVSDHAHGTSGLTNSQGQHSGHFPGSQHLVPSGSTIGVPAWNESGTFDNPHNHTVVDPTFNAGGHSHTIDASNQNVGGGTSFDSRSPFYGVNYMVWV